jgi:ABC-2 type transport system permease protein
MNPVWILAKRELNAFFNSLVGYMVMIIFLVMAGLFTWLMGNDIFFRKQADLYVFFFWAQWIFLFFIPAITMRQLAEEKRSGTIELLLTKAISDRQVVLGKFLACFLMVAITVAFTLPYYITVAQLGDVDHGAIFTGYFGLLLLGATYISIGLFASSITQNQIVAFILALFLSFAIQFLLGFIGQFTGGWIGELLNTLSMSEHYESISRGVLDSKDLVYFGSLIVFFLLMAELNVRNRS